MNPLVTTLVACKTSTQFHSIPSDGRRQLVHTHDACEISSLTKITNEFALLASPTLTPVHSVIPEIMFFSSIVVKMGFAKMCQFLPGNLL